MVEVVSYRQSESLNMVAGRRSLSVEISSGNEAGGSRTIDRGALHHLSRPQRQGNIDSVHIEMDRFVLLWLAQWLCNSSGDLLRNVLPRGLRLRQSNVGPSWLTMQWRMIRSISSNLSLRVDRHDPQGQERPNHGTHPSNVHGTSLERRIGPTLHCPPTLSLRTCLRLP